ncbi:MAG: tail fiber protein [Verrucomicrobiales bacterium]|nr:tail fiber protein [Verrucomicrobiales bacterium]
MKLSLLAVFLLVSSPGLLWSDQSGRLLPFQGRLTGASGEGGVDGVRTVQFKMYDAPVGGRSVWNGEVQRLTVNQGLISTVLGSKASLEGVDFGAPVYLEMTLDANGDDQISLADPPLLPRQTISPSVFAVEAANARKLAGFDWKDVFAQGSDHPPTALIAGNRLVPASIKAEQIAPQSITAALISPATITGSLLAEGTLNGLNLAAGSIDISRLAQAIAEALVPPGTITAFGGTNVPAGWLLCDGSALDAQHPKFSNLFLSIGQAWGNGSSSPVGALYVALPAGDNQTDFNLPDLRGRFLRGVSGATTRDPDREARTVDQPGGNTGNNVGSAQVDGLASHTHTYNDFRPHATEGTEVDAYLSGSNDVLFRLDSTRTTRATGGNETRPKNSYVHYLIKY